MLARTARLGQRYGAGARTTPAAARLLSTEKGNFKFFDPVEIKDNGVAIIRINGPGKMNVISDAMRAEAEELWRTSVAPNPSIKAVVYISAKPDNFIAGADINMIKTTPNKADLKAVCMNGHATFDYMAEKKVPTVAAINGSCLGGGLEWALHCDYRIASTSKKTVLGLPEVKLGLLPGWGGTQLLHPLVGLQAALDMMLTGRNIRPDRAVKMGLVDQVADTHSLETAAVSAAEKLASGSLKPRRKPKNLMQKLLEDNPLGRSIVLKKALEMANKTTGGHYPSPAAIIECVKNGFETSNKKAALEFEAQKFSELAATPVSAALIGLFDGSTALKKNRFGKPERPVKKIAVLGAGLMGAGIAQISAAKGMEVLLKDRDLASVGKGQAQIAKAAAADLKKKRLTKYDADLLLSRVIPLTDDGGLWQRHFAKADMVIEAVPENLKLKHIVIKQAEEFLPEHCVFASNTSAIPIRDIATASKRPEMVLGMHYFSPVPAMPLLEVIPHANTCKSACASAVDVGTRQGKTAIVVKDVPGFYVNRCAAPAFFDETFALVEDGVGLQELDSAMKKFGFPVGPITLADEVGLDVANHVRTFLSAADMGVRMGSSDASAMAKMVEKGLLGRKAGKGFYLYKGKDKSINPEAQLLTNACRKRELKVSASDIQDRIVCRFVNEAALCLQEGIIESPTDGDIGAVFGIGFPPFLGGPFRYLDQVGVSSYVAMMSKLTETHGARFEPCQLLKDYAKDNKKFFS